MIARAWTCVLIGALLNFLGCQKPDPSSTVAPDSLAQQREKLDATIWADEVEAQRHERAFVALWDELRASHDKYSVLAAFPLETLVVGTPENESDELGLGIVRTKLSQPNRRFSHDALTRQLARLREQGFDIAQTEWHHERFQPGEGPQPPRSEVSFVLHVIQGVGKADQTRFTVRGTLLVRWSTTTDSAGNPMPDVIGTRDVEILTRRGEPAFRHALSASRRVDPYASAMPVIAYDLDRDGDSELIFSRWNRVYWNDGRGEFREARFLDRFRPHWETGIIADFNGDTFPDFLTIAGQDRPTLYLGAEGGRFPSEGQPCAEAQLEEPSAITAGDVDADGDLDLWLPQYKLAYREGQMPTPFYDANDGFPAFLLINDGKGRFVDATESSGLAAKRHRRTYGSSLVDLDDDGDLDLMVVSDFAGLDIHANDGHGQFTDVTQKLVDQRHLFGMSHTLGDYNGDGRLDFYVIGMSSTTVRRLNRLGLGRSDRADIHRMRGPMTFGNRMYLAKDGRFEAPPYAQHVARTGWSWGTTSFDFDNDGDRDIYIGNGFRSGESSQDYCTRYWCHDVYTGSSQPDAEVQQLLAESLREVDEGRISWNGYEHNVLLMNLDGEDFVNVAFLLGVAFEYDSRCVIGNDLDGDGLPDLVVGEYLYNGRRFALDVHVYQNNLTTGNHWIGVLLHENGSGHSPIGAQVTLTSSAGRQVAQIVTGNSFMSQHANTVHFGLGMTDKVKQIEVRWPNEDISVIPNPAVDRYHEVAPRQ